jgi:hypothetical protein
MLKNFKHLNFFHKLWVDVDLIKLPRVYKVYLSQGMLLHIISLRYLLIRTSLNNAAFVKNYNSI